MRRTIWILAVMLLGACTSEPPATSGFSNTPAPSVSAVVTPLPEGATPPPAGPMEIGVGTATGAPGPGCVNGWTTPPLGSPLRDVAIDVILDRLDVRGRPVVGDMRVFDGPESPPSDKGYISNIRRWYVVLAVPGAPGAEGRFLVERRGFGTGLVAVAPLGTRGFRSADWVGFQYDPSAPLRRYPGLPGAWRGVPYDFVAGGAGLTIPGLPDELVRCLDGT